MKDLLEIMQEMHDLEGNWVWLMGKGSFGMLTFLRISEMMDNLRKRLDQFEADSKNSCERESS